MLLAVNVCMMIFLFVAVVQDFRQRAISWFLIPVLLIGFVYIAAQNQNLESALKDIVSNLCFIIIQLLLLTIYMSVKNKKLVNIVNTYLGIGDILFFVVLAAAFSPVNFIVFYLVSTILILLGFAFFTLMKKASAEIPLAGGMAGMMILLMIASFCIPSLNFYNDDFFISCLISE